MPFYIYAYENKITGKVYIGQTIATLDVRYKRDKYKGSHRFYNALQKYGLGNFERWVFKVLDTLQEADQEEIYWIAEMRSQLGRDNVYNIVDGGGGVPNLVISEEGRQKNSQSHKEYYTNGGTNAMLGKNHSPETRLRMGKTKGKTWKVIDGKRVWFDKTP